MKYNLVIFNILNFIFYFYNNIICFLQRYLIAPFPLTPQSSFSMLLVPI